MTNTVERKLTRKDARSGCCAVSPVAYDAEANAKLAESDLETIGCVSIPLRNRAKQIIGYAIIDKEDAALAAYQWTLNSSGYVRRNYKRKGESQREIRLNREVLGLAHGDPREGDHRNGDKLDNRRVNLRVVTKAQNATNKTRPQKHGKTTARGVFFLSREQKWCAQVCLNRKIVFYQRFKVYEDAVTAVAQARIRLGFLSSEVANA